MNNKGTDKLYSCDTTPDKYKSLPDLDIKYDALKARAESLGRALQAAKKVQDKASIDRQRSLLLVSLANDLLQLLLDHAEHALERAVELDRLIASRNAISFRHEYSVDEVYFSGDGAMPAIVADVACQIEVIERIVARAERDLSFHRSGITDAGTTAANNEG